MIAQGKNYCRYDVYVRIVLFNVFRIIYNCVLKGDTDGKKHPPVPVEEFAHYVNEMKANNNYEFQKEYDVSLQMINMN